MNLCQDLTEEKDWEKAEEGKRWLSPFDGLKSDEKQLPLNPLFKSSLQRVYMSLPTEQSKSIKGLLLSTGYCLELGDLQTEDNFDYSKLLKTVLEHSYKELNQQIVITNWWLSPSPDIWTLLRFLWLYWQ